MTVDVVFIGPAEGSQGGISAVIENYKKSGFWSRYNCVLYGTSIETDTRVYALLYQVWRIIGFFFYGLFIRPKVVSVHTASWNSFYRSFIYIAIARLVRLPVVLHIHPANFYEFYRRGGWVRKSLIESAGNMSAKIVFLTSSIRDHFVAVYPDKDLYVLPNPVNVGQFTRRENTPERNRLQLLFMGWIVKGKGVYDIVDVIPGVLKSFPDARFVFAGNKEVEQLRSMIKQRGLGEVTSVPGWVSGQEKVDLLLGSGALLLPSYSEGVPNVILEAMASGLPIITTPVGGIPSILQHMVSGLFVNPGDKAELESAILQLLRDEVLARKISLEAQRLALELYNVDTVGKELELIYRSFTEEHENIKAV